MKSVKQKLSFSKKNSGFAKQKLYCYVDETGQDTEGRLYIVATVVVGDERDSLNDFLGEAEAKSGKTRRKWTKSRDKERHQYIELALIPRQFKGKIFYKIYKDSKAYEDLMVLVIGRAINIYTTTRDITDYKATIVIDGLQDRVQKRVTKSLRQLGIKMRKVVGGRDESSPLLRLADNLAGMIRESEENKGDYKKIVSKLSDQGVISEL